MTMSHMYVTSPFFSMLVGMSDALIRHQHWAFVQFADSGCTETVYMNAENADLRLDTDNWAYIERYEWKPADSKSLVVMYELQIPDGVSSEDVYGMIRSKGREVVREKSTYRRFYGSFNCR